MRFIGKGLYWLESTKVGPKETPRDTGASSNFSKPAPGVLQALLNTKRCSCKVMQLPGHLVTLLADLRSRQEDPVTIESFDMIENAIKLAKGAFMFHVPEFVDILTSRMRPSTLNAWLSFISSKAGIGLHMPIFLKHSKCGT